MTVATAEPAAPRTAFGSDAYPLHLSRSPSTIVEILGDCVVVNLAGATALLDVNHFAYLYP